MKNDKIIASWNKIEPSESADERMLSAILERNRSIQKRKGKVNYMSNNKSTKKILIPTVACLAACLGIGLGAVALFNQTQSVSIEPASMAVSDAPISGSNENIEEALDSGAGLAADEEIASMQRVIMVNGVIYWDTFKTITDEVDESIVQYASSYTGSRLPEKDGETNSEPGTRYAVIDGTVVVEINGEWTIFEPSFDEPVDEEHYEENHKYSSELIDLQNKISAAMSNHELPFVTSSTILENPDRLYVTVNTSDESSIALLKSFDATGELLEIEFVPTVATEE